MYTKRKKKQIGTEEKYENFTSKSVGGQLLKQMILEGEVGPNSNAEAVFRSNALFNKYKMSRFIYHFPAYIRLYYSGEDLGVELDNGMLGGDRQSHGGDSFENADSGDVDELSEHLGTISMGVAQNQGPLVMSLAYIMTEFLVHVECDVRHLLLQIWLPSGASANCVTIIVEAGGMGVIVRYLWQSFLTRPLDLLRYMYPDEGIDDNHVIMHKFNEAMAVLRHGARKSVSEPLFSEMRIPLPFQVSEQPVHLSYSGPMDLEKVALVRLLQITGVATGSIRQDTVPSGGTPNRRRRPQDAKM